MTFWALAVVLLQSDSTQSFLQSISSYKLGFSQYMGNAMGAGIVIVLVVLVVGGADQIKQWLKKSNRR
jgi:hypothetical protein